MSEEAGMATCAYCMVSLLYTSLLTLVSLAI
jgi:hypothetical protein